MFSNRFSARVYILSVFLCMQFVPVEIFGQGQTSADTLAKSQPVPIPLVHLSTATETIREEVNLARSRMASESVVSKVDSQYVLFSENLEKEKGKYLVFRQITPNRQKLDVMIRRWSTFADRFSGLQRSLSRYQGRNSITLEALDFELNSWNLTVEKALEDSIPGEVVTSINKSIAEITQVIRDLKDQNNQILSIGTRIVEKKQEIAFVVADLENWIASGELNMLYRRHEPIWQTDFRRSEEDKARVGENTIRDGIHMVSEYFNNNDHDLNVYGLWLVLIMALILFLWKRLKELDVSDMDRRVQRMKEIVTKNAFATVTYLILLFIVSSVSSLPESLYEIFTIGILFTAMILLKPYAFREFRWIIVFVIIAFVLNTLKSYFWFSSANYRLFMYAEAFMALAVVGHNLRLRSKVKELGMGPIGKTLYKTIPLLVGIYATSIIANTLGYTNLSDTALKIGTQCAVVTVIAYGILIVLGGIAAAIITLRFENKADYKESYRIFLQQRTRQAVSAFAVIFWIGFFLDTANLYRPLVKSLTLWLTEPLAIGEMSFTPGRLLSFFLILIITFAVTRFIAVVVQGGLMRPLKLPRGIPSAISLVIRYFIIVFGVVVSLGALGVDLTGFSLMAGALGVGIGFGLQNIISNFVAGVILTFERPILPGDTVEVGAVLGVVEKIGVRSSHVRSFDGADVVVPNNTLLSNELTNWTQSDHKKRVEIKIGAAYGTDPNVVLKILHDVAMDYEHAHKNPEPLPLFDEFADSSLNFRLLFWVPVELVLKSRSDVSVEIYNRFKDHGITIPFPQQDVNIISNSGSTDSVTG